MDRKRLSSARRAALLAAVAVAEPACLAQEAIWTGLSSPSTNLWNDAGNWTAGAVPPSWLPPQSTDDAKLSGAGPLIIDVGAEDPSLPGVYGGSARSLTYTGGGYVLLSSIPFASGGVLWLGDPNQLTGAAAPGRPPNGQLSVADGAAPLTFADDTLVAYTLDGGFLFTSPAGNPASANDNGTIDLSQSQQGFAYGGTFIGLGGGSGGVSAGVILQMADASALAPAGAAPQIHADRGGYQQYGGSDAVYAPAGSIGTFQSRNDVNMLRLTATGAHTLPNDIRNDSPDKYLLIDGAGGQVTLTGAMLRPDAPGGALGTIASWGGTTVNIGSPLAGGNNEYPVTGTNANRPGGVGVASVNGPIHVYRANPDATLYASADDPGSHMGVIAGVRGQDAADVGIISRVVYYNQAEGGAKIAPATGTSIYRYSSLINESARYQPPRNADMIPLFVEVHDSAEVQVNGAGAAIVLDVRGDIIKSGPGDLTLMYNRGAAGEGARGGVTAPPGAPGVGGTYLGQLFLAEGRLNILTNGAGRNVDDVLDGALGSPDDAGNGVINYVLSDGTTLRVDFRDSSPLATYTLKSDLLSGQIPTDVCTLQVDSGGPAGGKPLTIGSPVSPRQVAAQPSPVLSIAGTLRKTGGGQLILGSTAVNGSGGSRTYAHAPGSVLDVADGALSVNGDQGSPATGDDPADARLTLRISQGTVVLGADQTLAGLAALHASGGRQSLDLNSPRVAGQYRSVRIYPSDGSLSAAEASLWASIRNANAAGAADPLDGIYDSAASHASHTNAAVGITDRAADAFGEECVLIRLTRKGDANLDGTVNFNDLLRLSQNYNTTGKTWDQGDFSYDTNINFADLLILSQNYNANFTSAEATAAVPEPGAALLMAGALVVQLARRSRLHGPAGRVGGPPFSTIQRSSENCTS